MFLLKSALKSSTTNLSEYSFGQLFTRGLTKVETSLDNSVLSNNRKKIVFYSDFIFQMVEGYKYWHYNLHEPSYRKKSEIKNIDIILAENKSRELVSGNIGAHSGN